MSAEAQTQNLVRVGESDGLKISNFLLTQGLGIANKEGVPASSNGRAHLQDGDNRITSIQDSGKFGLTVEHQDKNGFLQKYFGLGFNKDYFIGILNTKPDEDGNWNLEIYGRIFLDRLSDVASKLSKEFKTKVGVSLTQENTRTVNVWDYE